MRIAAAAAISICSEFHATTSTDGLPGCSGWRVSRRIAARRAATGFSLYCPTGTFAPWIRISQRRRKSNARRPSPPANAFADCPLAGSSLSATLAANAPDGKIRRLSLRDGGADWAPSEGRKLQRGIAWQAQKISEQPVGAGHAFRQLAV